MWYRAISPPPPLSSQKQLPIACQFPSSPSPPTNSNKFRAMKTRQNGRVVEETSFQRKMEGEGEGKKGKLRTMFFLLWSVFRPSFDRSVNFAQTPNYPSQAEIRERERRRRLSWKHFCTFAVCLFLLRKWDALVICRLRREIRKTRSINFVLSTKQKKTEKTFVATADAIYIDHSSIVRLIFP